MKKLLILAYDFPPYVSVGGLRPYSWAKYFHEFGVYPIVVTRQWSNKYKNHLDYVAPGESENVLIEQNEKYCIVRTPYKPNLSNRLLLKYGEQKFVLLRKMITACLEFCQWYMLCGTKRHLYKGAREYLKNNKVDAIIATGDPFILFRFASKLSKEFGVPWIADYRDPWADNARLKRKSAISRFNSRIEKKTLKTTKLITTVNVFFKSIIAKNVLNKEIEIIPNGYDDEAVFQVKDIKQSADIFTLAFVGTIFKWDPLESVLEVLSEIVKKRAELKIRFVFYGINEAEQINSLLEDKYSSIKSNVIIEPKIKNAELLKELRKANVLLLFNCYELIGTKVYEYMALNRKILLCYTNDTEAAELKAKHYKIEFDKGVEYIQQEDLIRETNSGFAIENKVELFKKLNILLDEFAKDGQIECNSVGAERFSRRHQTSKLADLIKNKICKES